jgi:hypothetical protein
MRDLTADRTSRAVASRLEHRLDETSGTNAQVV